MLQGGKCAVIFIMMISSVTNTGARVPACSHVTGLTSQFGPFAFCIFTQFTSHQSSTPSWLEIISECIFETSILVLFGQMSNGS